MFLVFKCFFFKFSHRTYVLSSLNLVEDVILPLYVSISANARFYYGFLLPSIASPIDCLYYSLRSFFFLFLQVSHFPLTAENAIYHLSKLNYVKFTNRIYSVWAPQCFFVFYAPPPPPVTNYMLLYSTLLCKKIARARGGVKNISSLRWGGGAKQNRSHISFDDSYNNSVL